MAAKGGSSGGNKNTVMGAVLGVLVLAIAGVWWMNSGGDEEEPVQETPVVETAAPEAGAPKAAGRAPDRDVQRERAAEEPAPTRQPSDDGERAPTRGRNQPAPEKLNTAPPA
ncbi:MAG: hypothetical protein BroJett003_03460 [Planctomycetota bacterium]|nr:MAG: hypothetical protein BroJett003_03460 [Planctomycetota bacterium]